MGAGDRLEAASESGDVSLDEDRARLLRGEWTVPCRGQPVQA
ncbi:hypothetical protein [Nonomuraea insulae]|uniref:Uncharacterized protein n=1 Tax=Nonomuraea insulae TaxID=1616787 RepID=A0ABW1D086_9ACTN